MTFFGPLEMDTDLTILRCDSGDPVWRKFADELQKLRSEIVIIVKVLSGDAGYGLRWL
ncbi:hypothetical protein [Aquitalea magnusonii]|uniref:hypothetical protein n=1 Tax=Aquitalea magnusonii TaxID=332411 RepID=UPI00142D37BA|nr:hypothetical protein [Aquitalea magnusonii]